MMTLLEVTGVPEMLQEHFDEFISHGFTVYRCDWGTPTSAADPHFEIHRGGRNVLHNPSVVSLSGLFVSVYDVIGPRVGAPATIVMYSDRHAATVTEILHTKDGRVKGVKVRRDTAVRADNNGMSESQDYTYANHGAGPEYEARLVTPKKPAENQLGPFGVYVNGPVKDWAYKIVVGYRREYHDYSF